MMKTILSTIPDEQARKELKQLTMYAWPGVLVGYFILSWLGVLGVLFGSRAFLLTFHAGNKSRKWLLLYRILNGVIVLAGAFETLWFWTHI
jgi:hypothetical protein